MLEYETIEKEPSYNQHRVEVYFIFLNIPLLKHLWVSISHSYSLTSLSLHCRQNTQEKQISKNKDLNNSIRKLYLTDIEHPPKQRNNFFPSLHVTFTNINPILNHKKALTNFKELKSSR